MRTGRRGFSLIELLATVMILSLGLVSVSTLFIGGTISTAKAKRISAATNRAQQEMERLRSAGFSGCIVDTDVFPAASGYTIVQQNDDLTGRVAFTPSGLPSATGYIDIGFYDSGAGIYPNLKTVVITVTWSGGKPAQGQVKLQTYIANHP